MSYGRDTDEIWERLISTDAGVATETGNAPAKAGDRFTVPPINEARYILAGFDPIERTWLALRFGGGMTPVTVWITHEMLHDKVAVTRL